MFPGELVRDTIVVAVDLDMVIDVDPCPLPFGIFVGLQRKGFEGRLVERIEEGFSRGVEFLELAVIELFQGLEDGLVELVDAEEVVVSESGQDPALSHEDGGFHFSFVPGTPHPGRDDGDSIMLRKLQVSGVDVGFVSAGLLDPYLEIIRDEDLGDAAEELEGVYMRSNPGRQILGGRSFSKGIAAGSESSYKDLSLGHLAGGRIDDGDGLAGIIHKEFLPGPVLLPEGYIELLFPLAIEVAELAVLIALWIDLLVLVPQELQSHPFLSEFLV